MDDAANWLQAWDSQGTHRTGTDGDNAGAAWLHAEAAALGADPVMEAFRLDRLDPVETWLEIDGTRIPAIPVFDAPPTDGVSAPLSRDGGAVIKVVELSPQAVYTESYRAMRRTADHQALVIVCDGQHPGMGLLNAEQFPHPYGAPAIHLDSAARAQVRQALDRGAVGHVVSRSIRTPTDARNVVVTLPGRHRDRTPLVVMTPRSSWWQSTSERGGGIVCWLRTMQALLAEPPACDVIMTANSGHELGHIGLDDFIARRPGWDGADGATWVHYGANIGATGGQLSVMSASQDLRQSARAALEAEGHPPDTMASPTQVPSGETRDIHRAGGRYVTLVGSNPLFHLPQDRWPHSVDVPAIARIAAGAARMVVALTR